MIKDFVRFLIIASLVVSGLLFSLYGLRLYGENRPKSTYQTPLIISLFQSAPFEVEALPENWHLLNLGPKKVFLKIEFNGNEWKIRSLSQGNPLEPSFPVGKLVDKWAETQFFINVELKSHQALSELFKHFEKNQRWKRVLFMSAADGIIKDMRQLAPKWSFSTGPIFLTRILSLTNLGLGALVDIPGDVLYVSRKVNPSQSEIIQLKDLAKTQKKFLLLDKGLAIPPNMGPHGRLVN